MKKIFKIILNTKKNNYFKYNMSYLINKTFFYKIKIPVFYPLLVPRSDTEKIINTNKKISIDTLKKKL